MHHAYLFEVRGIQRFLFASGKLRDMLAGSELLDHVCAANGLLDQTLRALSLLPSAMPRRAGGTFYLVFSNQDDAQRFRAAWRLAFGQWVPGVEWVDTLSVGARMRDTVGDGIAQLAKRRNLLQAELPNPGPLVERSPRTGLAAVWHNDGESMDAATATLRRFKRPAESETLEKRFLDDSDVLWPRNFEEQAKPDERFPLSGNRMVGVIHADGNGIGQVLRQLNAATAGKSDKDYDTIYSTFSKSFTEATHEAARRATEQVLLPNAVSRDGIPPMMPARPLILGGDDLSIIVRADLALDFARAFLLAFEASSARALQALRDVGADALPERLTAAAGICFVKCTYPFQSAHALAESLCKRAKQEARNTCGKGAIPPASLAFHKMEGALAEDADTLFQQFHHVTAGDGRSFQLSLPAYGLAEHTGLPQLDDLYALADVFAHTQAQRLNDRPLRELATLWRQDPAVAAGAYQRWRTLAAQQQPQALARFDQHLAALLGTGLDAQLPASAHVNDPGAANQVAHSPLSDLLGLLSIKQTAEAHQETHA